MKNQKTKSIAQPFFCLYKNIPYKTLLFIFALFLQAEVSANVVGSVPGSFSVSPSGSASYNIPIEIPKGINGMQPELSFVYDSQSGNGLLGMGWGLAGLSAITRCPKNYAQDYQINGVDFTTTDRLCLDGQRLVLANGSNDDGSYWAENAEYRTEIATFSKITRIGTSYFQVETKDGRISEYGNGNNSIQHVKDIITGVQKILSWAVSSISDQHGNSIDYFYNDDVNNGDHRITSIEYAGNISIQFSYIEPRIDPIKGYLAGARLNILGALSAVSTSVNMNLVREYRLTFAQSIQTKRSEIVNIAMCDGASPQNCVPASQFVWSETIPALEEPTQPSLAVGAANGAASFSQEGKSTWIADVNGDGLSDYLWIPYGGYDVWVAKSTGDGFEAAQKWLPNGTGGVNSYSYSGTQTWVADVNGDGLSDYLWIPYGKYEVWLAKSTGTGFLTPEQWLTAGAANGASTLFSFNGQQTWIADVNGDGLSDYLWVPYAGNNAVWVAKSTGDGVPVVKQWLAAGAANGAASFSQEGKSTWIADVNGDGLSDYLWIPYGGYDVWVAKSTGDGFEAQKWLPNGTGGVNSYSFSGMQTWVADVNGDGLSDYLWIPYGKYEVWVAKSTGTGFLTSELWLAAGAAYSTSYSHEGRYTWVADVNGDGLSDYLWMPYAGNNAIWVAKSNSTGAPVVEEWLATGAANGAPTYSLNGLQAWMADFTGDGLLDYMWGPYGRNDIWLAKSTGTPIDAVEQITNGLGANIDVAYQPLTNKSIYLKDTDAVGYPIHAYPVTDFQGAVQVVTSASTDNALGTQNTNTYEYGGMKIHKLGRGSLGFRWTETTDQETGIKTQHEFQQVRLDGEPDFPFVGNVVSVVKKLPNGKVINSLTNVLAETSGFPSSPYVASSVSVEYDLDDAINNVTTEISTVQKNRTVSPLGNLTYEKTTSFEPDLTTHIVEVNRVFNNAGITPYEQAQLLSETSTSTGVDASSIINNKSYTYYPSGLLETETREPGNPAYELMTSYGYDGFGNRTSVTVNGADIQSRASTTQYDVSGRFPVISKNAFDHTVTTTFDPVLGTALSTTDASGLIASQSYDSFGRTVNSVLPNGTMVSTTRSWCAGPCTVGAIGAGLLPQYISYSLTTRYLGADGVTEYKPSVINYFDKLGREVRSETTGFDGEILYQDTNYDGLGRVAATTQIYDAAIGIKNPTLNTSYDLLGRLRQLASPENGITTIDYSGIVTTSTNNGRSKKETKNAIGQLLAVEDAIGQVQTYEYNAIGKRVKTTDSMGNILAVSYDGIGRKISMDDPDMGHWAYTYDVLGQLKTQTDAKGQITSLEYDKLGRKIRRLDHDGTETTWDYADDMTAGGAIHAGIGRLDNEMIKSASGPLFDQHKVYAYNEYGQPDQVITALLTPISYDTYFVGTAYDQYGRVDIVSYPSSTDGASTTGELNRFKVKYSYQNGYLKSIDKADGSKNYWTADDRNAKGQLTLMTHGNGVVTSQVFDEAGRKTSINVGPPSSYFNVQYSYDSIGNLVTNNFYHGVGSQQLVSETNSYDLLNRLTSVDSSSTGLTSYAYDGLGNITQKYGETYLYEGTPHAVTKVGSTVYGYDLNGNMTFGAGRSISWSPFNKPVQIEDSNTRLNFRYGIDRSRYQQTILDKSTGDTDTITYIGGLFEVVEKPTLTEYKHYIKAGNDTVAVHLRRTDASNETTYLHKDRLGSLVAVTDDSGASKAHFNYDAFGKRMPVDGEAVVNPLIAEYTRGFTGHESLDDLGLIHMNGRVYSPELGRFISADPFIQFQTNQQSYNRYSYVLNNPLGYTDPSGFRSVREHLRRIGKLGGQLLRNSMKYSATGAIMYSKPVKGYMLRHKRARQIGQIGAAVADYFVCGGACSATYSAYITDISGGTYGQIGAAFGRSLATSYVGGEVSRAVSSSSSPLLSSVASGSVNGYLQTGNSEGFWRGAASGLIPADLWMTDSFKNSAWANGFISVARDGIRGGMINGREGAKNNAVGGLVTNLAGHLYAVSSGGTLDKFKDGAWHFKADSLLLAGKTPAMALGNVVTYAKNGSYEKNWAHERFHVFEQSALGASYLPVQALSQWSGIKFMENSPMHVGPGQYGLTH